MSKCSVSLTQLGECSKSKVTPLQTLSKALDISSAAAVVAHELLKALAILSDATVTQSAVDWEDLK